MSKIVPLQDSPLIEHLCAVVGVTSLHDFIGMPILIIPEGRLSFTTTIVRISHLISGDPEGDTFTEVLYLELFTQKGEEEIQIFRRSDLTYDYAWSVVDKDGVNTSDSETVKKQIFLGKENKLLSL